MLDINKISSAPNIPTQKIPVISIKELGVLRSIKILDNILIITITPTYSGCPAMDRFQKDIKEKLAILNVNNYKNKKCNMTSVSGLPDWITEEAKEKAKKTMG